jgi:DNA-binding beta-propeller fold protein YncE
MWGRRGSGAGEFNNPLFLAFGPDGTVFVDDSANDRVQYFTPAGSFLGSFGGTGSGPGQLSLATGVAAWRNGARIYVGDFRNCRVQYFNRNEPAVTPTSLGRIRALFR